VNVDYGAQTSAYPILGNDQLIPPSFPPSSNRGWTPAPPQMTKTTPMYLEQDMNYNNEQIPYHSTYQLRPTISPEPKSTVHPVSIPMTINGSSLPTLPASGADRVLPFPATRTALPTQVGPFIRATTVAHAHPGYHSYDSIINSNPLSCSKTIATSAIPGSASLPPDAYIPYSSSSPESLASSTQAAYSPQQLSQQQSELYASSSDGLYHGNEAPESSYGPSSSEKRNSQSNQDPLSPGGSIPSMSSGILANGHAYTPFNGGSTYPPPPMDIPAPIPTHQISALSTSISAS
jgi:hypothetical protein